MGGGAESGTMKVETPREKKERGLSLQYLAEAVPTKVDIFNNIYLSHSRDSIFHKSREEETGDPSNNTL